jgi:iron complex outermembrane receptor protein
LGNPDFQSESLVGYEAGYRVLLHKTVYVDFAAFHNDYSDLQSFGAQQVSFVATPPPHLLVVIPYTNAIGGSTNGFEIAPSFKPTNSWKISGSYSLVAINVQANAPTSDISATGSVSTYEGSTPQHQAELMSSFDLPKGVSFTQFYRYASELPAQKVRGYSTLDLNLGWAVNPQLRLSVVGQNLLQPHHEEWGTGDPNQLNVAVRRGAYIKLTWTSR